jgi:two-component system, NtrC family, nitrogen regulation sensor histidine kinase NtrY
VDFRAELRRRSRDTRWVVAVLTASFVVLVFLYYLVQRGRDLPSALVTNQVLLFALRNLNAILILVIFFVLGRNLVKLWVERRGRVLGSRFKTKLVATYIGLSLVPVLVLFLYASELLQGSIDRWFSASLSNLLEQGNAVSQALQTTIERRNQRDAARLVQQLAPLDLDDAGVRAGVRTQLDAWRLETGADIVAAYAEETFVNAVVDPQSGLLEVPEIGAALIREALARGRAARVREPPDTRGRVILGAASLPARPGRHTPVVVVGTLLDPLTATRSAQLVEAFQTYRQVEVQKGDFKASYYLMFVLVTLLILLASSWMGLFLARRLMSPLMALGDGLRRVSAGDLEARIEVPADDEIGVVVEAFHKMTDELRTSRTALEASNRNLTLVNRALDAERAQIAAVLDNLAAGVVALDGHGRVLSVNGAAQQMLRANARDLVGRDLEEAFADDPRRILAAFVARARASDSPKAAEQLSFPVGGTWRTFDVRGSGLPPAPGSDEGEGLVLVLEDLTELIRAQKLATWTEAARRVAHEIKNPLTPIRLAAERLRARQRQGEAVKGEDDGALVERSVDIIVKEVANMQQLVDEFSRFARMPGPHFAPTRLDPIVDDLLELYRGLKTGVQVSGRVAPETGEVGVDPEQIRRVMINLLDNALEATAPPGDVRIDVERRGELLEIAVADSGRGIRPEDRDKLFLPYFSRKGRGSGMGLAIVQRIVADHDGTITVEDNAPRGTIFRVTLPARLGAGGEAAAEG